MNSVALLTGSSGALGQRLQGHLLDAGYRLWAIDRPARVSAKPDDTSIHWIGADLTDEAATQKALKVILTKEKKIALAVLAAGGYQYGDIAATSTADIHNMMAINFTTAYHVIRPLFAHMCIQKGGHIVLIGAQSALQPELGVSSMAYALSKSLLFSLAEMLNVSGKEAGVRVSMIVPSIIDTPANRQAMPSADHTQWVPPDAIARAVLRIADDDARLWQHNVLKLYHCA